MDGNNTQLVKRYMPGIDGLRAISVIAVIAYHLNIKWAQGGLLGVGVFFVLSGYLITDQLLLEWKVNNRIALWSFWKRRFRRLLPAMTCMLILVGMWLMVTGPSRLFSLKGDFFSSLFYVNNWYLILHEVSYFKSFGPASPIGHLWSLSIEEQFYAAWPLVLLLGIRLAPRRGRLVLYIFIMAAVSALAMAIMYIPGADPSRVYYGTDTRAFAILTGAALAVIWPSWQLRKEVSRSAKAVLDIAGGAGLFLLIRMICRTNEYDDSLYRYGFLNLSLVSAVLIAVLAHPASRLGKILGCRPLTWLGRHSYSLYIWHYPVIILLSPAAKRESLGLTTIVLQLTVILILSALSFKFIEEPFRTGRFRAQLRSVRYRRLFKPVTGTILAILAIIMLASWKMSEGRTLPVTERITQADQQQGAPTGQDETSSSPASAVKGIAFIGDSLSLNVASYLESMLPGIVIDGKEGRQMSQAQEVVDAMRANGKLGGRVIFELGTNGPFNKATLRSLLDSLQDMDQLYLVTARVPKSWQAAVNNALKEVAREYQNVTIIDWNTASQNKSELFYQDGVHLTPEGAKYYASVVAEQIKQDLKL
jgi:peptidoglycan/LPS O-acetylase OafA/YrhL